MSPSHLPDAPVEAAFATALACLEKEDPLVSVWNGGAFHHAAGQCRRHVFPDMQSPDQFLRLSSLSFLALCPTCAPALGKAAEKAQDHVDHFYALDSLVYQTTLRPDPSSLYAILQDFFRLDHLTSPLPPYLLILTQAVRTHLLALLQSPSTRQEILRSRSLSPANTTWALVMGSFTEVHHPFALAWSVASSTPVLPASYHSPTTSTYVLHAPAALLNFLALDPALQVHLLTGSPPASQVHIVAEACLVLYQPEAHSALSHAQSAWEAALLLHPAAQSHLVGSR